MKKIKKDLNNILIIDKSEFITNIFRVQTVEQVNEILTQYRKKYYDATHNCYAYILGDDAMIQKCSDDGEPQKTAGYPMLDVLKKQEISDVLAITTRYFGGIKLGAGGLIRAYSQSVSACLLLADFVVPMQFNKYLIDITYSEFNNLNTYLSSIDVINSDFTDKVSLTVIIPVNHSDVFLEEIKNLTKSKALVSFISTELIDV